jgi:hypothetical protein
VRNGPGVYPSSATRIWSHLPSMCTAPAGSPGSSCAVDCGHLRRQMSVARPNRVLEDPEQLLDQDGYGVPHPMEAFMDVVADHAGGGRARAPAAKGHAERLPERFHFLIGPVGAEEDHDLDEDTAMRDQPGVVPFLGEPHGGKHEQVKTDRANILEGMFDDLGSVSHGRKDDSPGLLGRARSHDCWYGPELPDEEARL